jgi:hypothetical protein
MGFLLFRKFEHSHSQASLDLRIHEAMSVDCEQHSSSAAGDNPKVRRLVVVISIVLCGQISDHK